MPLGVPVDPDENAYRAGASAPPGVGGAVPVTPSSRPAAAATHVPLPARAPAAHSATAGASSVVVTMPRTWQPARWRPSSATVNSGLSGHGQGAEPLAGEEGDDEVGVVGEHDGEGVPGPDVAAGEGRGPAFDGGGQLVPGQAAAGAAVDERGPGPAAGDRRRQLGRHAGAAGHGSRPPR